MFDYNTQVALVQDHNSMQCAGSMAQRQQTLHAALKAIDAMLVC
jgi:hypothetical protein